MEKKDVPSVVEPSLVPDEITTTGIPIPASSPLNQLGAALQSAATIAKVVDKEKEREYKLATKVNETGNKVIDSSVAQQEQLSQERSANAAMYRTMAAEAETPEEREKYAKLATTETDKMERSQVATKREHDHIYDDQAASRDESKKGMGTGAKIAIGAGLVTLGAAIANPDAVKKAATKVVETVAEAIRKQ